MRVICTSAPLYGRATTGFTTRIQRAATLFWNGSHGVRLIESLDRLARSLSVQMAFWIVTPTASTRSGRTRTSRSRRHVSTPEIDNTPDSLVFLTVFGGGNGADVDAIALGPSSTVFITGDTTSTDFPRTNNRGLLGSRNAYVLGVDAVTGSTLVYSTLLGGDDTWPSGQCLVVDAAGRAYVSGRHEGASFPDSPNHQTYGPVTNGTQNKWLAVLDDTGEILP